MDIEFYFTIGMVSFAVLFIVWIFVRSFSDLKKEKAFLTEIYQKYGVKTNAEIIHCRNHVNTIRTMPYKYEVLVKFNYNSPIKGCSCSCQEKILTNNQDCKNYENIIPIIYIPQYADYANEFVDSKKICSDIGIKVYRYWDKMIIWAADISTYTNLSEL